VLDVRPFGVSAIRISAPGVQLTGITPYPSEAVMTAMEARYRELSMRLSRLNRGQGGGPGAALNLGFEPDRPSIRQAQNAPQAPSSYPVTGGWSVAGAKGSTITIDPLDPHGGEGSLKLTAPAVPASVVSESFVPAAASGLSLQGFFRSEPGGARLRVWIEGEAAGKAFLRQSEIEVSGGWEARAVRTTDLPAGGLDKLRLRFELLTPGTLWIDDLRILGDVAPESVRLNAQRTLLAALQAYRARRYAEFARLASSHWARHPSLLGGGRAASPGQLSSVPGPARPGAAAASALSPDRTVR
jgi:hypothetical protein